MQRCVSYSRYELIVNETRTKRTKAYCLLGFARDHASINSRRVILRRDRCRGKRKRKWRKKKKKKEERVHVPQA